MSTRTPRRSLADAFSPASASAADRGAGLANLLPPRPSAVRPDASAEPATSAAPGRQDQPPPREPGAGGLSPTQDARPPKARKASAAPDKVRNVAVYLPLPVLDAFRGTSRSRDMTYADLLVEAASAHLEGLEGRFDRPARPAGTGMPVRSTQGQGQAQPQVQVQVRLDGHQVAWLDAQAERLGAPSRSALVVALLQAHLGLLA